MCRMMRGRKVRIALFSHQLEQYLSFYFSCRVFQPVSCTYCLVQERME